MQKQVDLALLIDDSDVDLFIQKRFIEIAGFAKSIKAYKYPTQAIDYLKQTDSPLPEVIFLDLNMPDMDGFGFMDKFMQLPQKIREMAKVIILTSSSNHSDRKRAEEYSSVKNFISKPLSLEALQSLRENMNS